MNFANKILNYFKSLIDTQNGFYSHSNIWSLLSNTFKFWWALISFVGAFSYIVLFFTNDFSSLGKKVIEGILSILIFIFVISERYTTETTQLHNRLIQFIRNFILSIYINLMLVPVILYVIATVYLEKKPILISEQLAFIIAIAVFAIGLLFKTIRFIFNVNLSKVIYEKIYLIISIKKQALGEIRPDIDDLFLQIHFVMQESLFIYLFIFLSNKLLDEWVLKLLSSVVQALPVN